VNEEKLRKEAVRRRRLGESPETIAGDLGRTSRCVRKWVARHEDASHDESWLPPGPGPRTPRLRGHPTSCAN
jgi:hypothetical protein